MVKIEELMSRTVRVCAPGDALETAARWMWEEDCGALPVVGDAGRVVGMITDRDLCMASYTRGLPLRELRVADAMAKRIVACWADDSVEAALDQMYEHRVRRLPVVDADNRLVGMLSLADLARSAACEARGSVRERRLARVGATFAAIATPHGEERGLIEVKFAERPNSPARDDSPPVPVASASVA